MARQHELRLRRELEIRTIVCEQHRQTIIYHETQSWVKMGGSKSNNRMSRHSRCGRCTGARGWKRCRARPPQPASRLHGPSAIPSQRCLRAPTTSPSRRRRRNASPSAALLAEHARSRGRENGLLRLATVCNSAAVGRRRESSLITREGDIRRHVSRWTGEMKHLWRVFYALL
jgi:hypothetical protein